MAKQEDPRYKAAKKRVGELKEFYTHLVVYITVNFFLFIIDLQDGELSFFFYPLLGWGIGMVIHAWETFAVSKSWEERKIAELMGEKRKNESGSANDYFTDI